MYNIYIEGHVGLDIVNLYQHLKKMLQACVLDLRGRTKKLAKGNIIGETCNFGSDSKFWYH